MSIEIMDTTLRDGEQTNGVSFMPHEKLLIAKQLLRTVGVDRLEVASARVSEGEKKAVSDICAWAARHGYLERVEVLGFVDRHTSIDWIISCGGKVINLLCKGSRRHCELQLRKTPEAHLADILSEVDYATQQGISVNVYLEDWSNGMQDPDYVFYLIDHLKDSPIRRFMLPDTLGVLNPLLAVEYMRKIRKRYPDLHFDFHGHNDYDLAIANVSAAVLCGFQGIHTAVNGLGERAGNAPLSSV
jgi:D-citramalate synthase